MESAAISEVITKNFYFTGGTALSEFYLHHRISEDLDFFSEEELDELSLEKWVKEVSKKYKVEAKSQRLRGELVYLFEFPDGVLKVDFAYFPFPPLGSFTKYKNLRIADINDMAVNKVQAITTRLRGRDFVDLYEILKKEKIPVTDLLKNYRLKFEVSIPPEQLAKRFLSVKDASDQPRFLGERKWEGVEKFFLEEAKKMEVKIIR